MLLSEKWGQIYFSHPEPGTGILFGRDPVTFAHTKGYALCRAMPEWFSLRCPTIFSSKNGDRFIFLTLSLELAYCSAEIL